MPSPRERVSLLILNGLKFLLPAARTNFPSRGQRGVARRRLAQGREFELKKERDDVASGGRISAARPRSAMNC